MRYLTRRRTSSVCCHHGSPVHRRVSSRHRGGRDAGFPTVTPVRPTGPPVPVGTATVLVATGGAVGATARWWLGTALPTPSGSFPWATFGINVAGSFLLALLLTSRAARHPRRSAYVVPLLGPGLLGGFTTLSATSEEGRVLLATGHGALAAAYLLGTLLAALLAVAAAGQLAAVREGDG